MVLPRIAEEVLHSTEASPRLAEVNRLPVTKAAPPQQLPPVLAHHTERHHREALINDGLAKELPGHHRDNRVHVTQRVKLRQPSVPRGKNPRVAPFKTPPLVPPANGARLPRGQVRLRNSIPGETSIAAQRPACPRQVQTST